MVSGFTLESRAVHVVLPYWVIVGQETTLDFAIRKYPDMLSICYRIRCGFIFSAPESGLKNIWICCQIHQMHVDSSCIQKEKVAD